MLKRISLGEALAAGNLEPFIHQEEGRQRGGADRRLLESLLNSIIVPQPEDQTSRSPDCDDSPEK